MFLFPESLVTHQPGEHGKLLFSMFIHWCFKISPPIDIFNRKTLYPLIYTIYDHLWHLNVYIFCSCLVIHGIIHFLWHMISIKFVQVCQYECFFLPIPIISGGYYYQEFIWHWCNIGRHTKLLFKKWCYNYITINVKAQMYRFAVNLNVLCKEQRTKNLNPVIKNTV